jgi:hypothetical protein
MRPSELNKRGRHAWWDVCEYDEVHDGLLEGGPTAPSKHAVSTPTVAQSTLASSSSSRSATSHRDVSAPLASTPLRAWWGLSRIIFLAPKS